MQRLLVRTWQLAVLATLLVAMAGCNMPPVVIISWPGTPAAELPPVQAPAQPTATAVALAPTATPNPPTATPVPPTATPIPPTATATAIPPSPTAALPSSTATSAPPTATRAATPTATRPAPRPTATATPTAKPLAARPLPTATPAWPQELVITEAEIERQAAANAVPGLEVQGLDVEFGNGAMTVAFDSLRYGFLSLRDVVVEGRFTVNNGQVTFVADRIQPRNLATAAIPNFVNQALSGQLGQWYVESLRIEPDQMVVQVRPR